jgi:diphosphomevalonate decarboxylase
MVDIKLQDGPQDTVILNNQPVSSGSAFSARLSDFLDIFRSNLEQKPVFYVNITSNIPIAAGLASSACGFASLVKALDSFYAWQLPARELSLLARLGSGSASRSVLSGFVEWHAGIREDGLDSYADALKETWPELCVGLLIMNASEKSISSREAMQRTVTTSALYSAWPAKVSQDLLVLKHAIANKDFELLGKTAESNALTMHATMLSAWPPVTYALPDTIIAMQKIWQLRSEGLAVYFTQDAGPNLTYNEEAIYAKFF